MNNVLKNILKKIFPEVFRIKDVILRIDQGISTINNNFEELRANLDDPYIKLKRKIKLMDPYQPIWGLNIQQNPKRSCQDRCKQIFQYFDNNVESLKILDVGCSLGYVSSYFADKGAVVEGWDYGDGNVEVCNLSKDISGLDIKYSIKTFNLTTVNEISENQYDIVLILSVIHHTIAEYGIKSVKEMISTLLDKVPFVIFELAQKGEDSNLYWDKHVPEDIFSIFDSNITIEKIGAFNNHLSDKTRPLIIAYKNSIKVNNKTYLINKISKSPYKGHMHPNRLYYWGSEIFIKKIYFNKVKDDRFNLNEQIIKELFFDIEKRYKYKFCPELLDFEINNDFVIMVYRKIKGHVLSEILDTLPLDKKFQIIKSVYDAVKQFELDGFYHNDIRTWNVMYDFETGSVSLIDFGLYSSSDHDKLLISLKWFVWALLSNKMEPKEYSKNYPPKWEKLIENLPNSYKNILKSYNLI